jgi:hypothetical protein
MSAPDLRSVDTKYLDAEIACAVARERERCAKIAERWLADLGGYRPETISAQKWACDAIRDIIGNIREIDTGDD